jgi:hypothetical protein
LALSAPLSPIFRRWRLCHNSWFPHYLTACLYLISTLSYSSVCIRQNTTNYLVIQTLLFKGLVKVTCFDPFVGSSSDLIRKLLVNTSIFSAKRDPVWFTIS